VELGRGNLHVEYESCCTVSGIWLVHLGMFRRVQYANCRAMQVYLVLLMAVASFHPASLAAEAIRKRWLTAPGPGS